VVVLGAVVGVLASLVQFLGLIRWPFLVPYLARVAADSEPDSPRGEAVDVAFQAFNRYLGFAVGEHLGYGFTGIWSILAGVALIDSTVAPDWLGVVGVVIGPLFLVCSFEFVGRFEESGWKLAGLLTPVTYIAWSMWLLAVGIALLV
jgi:cytochrome c biogenesis protein CcdA